MIKNDVTGQRVGMSPFDGAIRSAIRRGIFCVFIPFGCLPLSASKWVKTTKDSASSYASLKTAPECLTETSQLSDQLQNKGRLILWFILISLLLSCPALAQSSGARLFNGQFQVGNFPVAIIVPGYEKDSSSINKLFALMKNKANDIYNRTDHRSSASEIGKLNAAAGKGPFKISEDVFAAIETAIKASGYTSGEFDIAYCGQGNYKDIALNKDALTVELKKPGMKLCLDPMMSGFMAELIARYIYASNMQNVVVKVGNVFRAIGQSLTGPWQIEIQDEEGTFAHRALTLSLINSGAAAISRSQFRQSRPVNMQLKKEIAPPCRGSVVLMEDAALAEAIAYAAFTMGPDGGFKLISKQAKGLIVDDSGKFLRTPGF